MNTGLRVDHEKGEVLSGREANGQEGVSCLVVLNTGSGTIKELLENEAVLPDLEERLRRNGWKPEIALVKGEEIEDTVKAGIERGVDCVIAGGGDGTTSSIAKLLLGSDTALGILPFGTLNLAARDLDTPLDPLDAISALKPGRRRRIDVLEVDDRLCLCLVVIGVYTKLLRDGNEFHGRSWWRKFTHLVSGFARVFVSSPPMKIEFKTESDRSRSVKTRLLFIVPGGYADTWGLIPRRTSLEAGRCRVLVPKHLSLFALSKLTLRFLTGRAQQDPDLEAFDAEEIEVRIKRRKRLWMAIDGELFRHQLPVRFRLRKRALLVIDPSDE